MKPIRIYLVGAAALLAFLTTMSAGDISLQGIHVSEAKAFTRCQRMVRDPKYRKKFGTVYYAPAKTMTGVYCRWTGSDRNNATNRRIALAKCNANKSIKSPCKKL